MKYWAFLSYSHADKKWGDWLHKALETYRVPRRLVGKESREGKIPRRLFPIFRDREELPVSADLGANITEALRQSRYLIVICSPQAAKSVWVNEEVIRFKKLRRENLILGLIIAGEPKKGCEKYLGEIQRRVNHALNSEQVIQKIQYIPDNETELYFKAADVLALPYTHVFQSGVLFLAYSFGLPVVAADVGSFREDIIEGRTGFLCRPCDPGDLARAILTYFKSDLFKTLDNRRREIRDYANERHSWDIVGELTRNVYAELLGSD